MAEKFFMEVFEEEAPSANKAFFDLIQTLETDGGLDAKTFQLVYMGIQASRGQDGSVAAHAALAKKAGATRDEVRGAVLITLMTVGINGVASCLSAALDAYDKA